MANIFRNLFGHKKTSHSKGADEENGNEPPLMSMMQDRDASRRSYRAPSSSRSMSRAARFQDDSMLPPTAAYHTQNSSRVRRGPKSCPGEYFEEEVPASSRSFNVDSYREPPRGNRRQQHQNPHQNLLTSSSSSRQKQRWETSEYGSENTSPIGYHHHRRKYNEDDEEDEETVEEDNDTLENYKKSIKYQELKRKIRAHYEERLFNYERTQRSDHRQIRELEKEKDDLVKMLIQSNSKLEKEKKKSEYFRRKWQEAEQQVKQPNFTGYGFQTPQQQQFQTMFQFGVPNGSSQRYSFMAAPMHPISSSNTPTTSAMDTTGGGAGESLIPPSDVSSFLAPLSSVSTPLDAPGTSTSTVVNANQKTSTSSNFYPDDDEDQDETKNFRDDEDLELPRGMSPANTLVDEIDGILKDKMNLTVLAEGGKDSGFSTTPDDEKKKEVKL